MSARAGIVVTGTEVLTGRIQDRNGPWLSDRLLELGVELAYPAQTSFTAAPDGTLIMPYPEAEAEAVGKRD